MIKLLRRGKITDRELDAVLADVNDKISTTLERGADTTAGLRALLAADRAHSTRPVEHAVDIAVVAASPARPSEAAEAVREEPPARTAPALALSAPPRTGFVIIGLAGLVVATAFAAVADLRNLPDSNIAGATETVSDARSLTSITSLRGPATPGTVNIGGHSYPGFTIPTGCTDTVVETTLDPARYESLLLHFAATGPRPVRYRVDVDHLTRSTGTVSANGSDPTSLVVPLRHTNINAAPSTTASSMNPDTGNVTVSITASTDGCTPAELAVGAAVVTGPAPGR